MHARATAPRYHSIVCHVKENSPNAQSRHEMEYFHLLSDVRLTLSKYNDLSPRFFNKAVERGTIYTQQEVAMKRLQLFGNI